MYESYRNIAGGLNQDMTGILLCLAHYGKFLSFHFHDKLHGKKFLHILS